MVLLINIINSPIRYSQNNINRNSNPIIIIIIWPNPNYMLGLTVLNKTIKTEVENYITMKLMPLVADPNRCSARYVAKIVQ